MTAPKPTPEPSERPDDKGRCPLCGSATIGGFGLAGGGYGPYWFCSDDACDYFHKEPISEDDE